MGAWDDAGSERRRAANTLEMSCFLVTFVLVDDPICIELLCGSLPRTFMSLI